MLKQLIDAYLFKDILQLENIKYPQDLYDLVYLLAHQIGQIVSINELSRELGIDVKTVKRYLWLLEKTFVIVSVGSFSRNLRTE